MTFYANILESFYCKDYTEERVVNAHKRYLKEHNLKTEGKYYSYLGEYHGNDGSTIIIFVQDNIYYEIAIFVSEMCEPDIWHIKFGKTRIIFDDHHFNIPDNIDENDNIKEDVCLDIYKMSIRKSSEDDNYILIGNKCEEGFENFLYNIHSLKEIE